MGKGAKERVGFELAAGLARGGEAGEEAGEGSRSGQGVGQVRALPAQVYRLAKAGLVEVDGGRREELRGLASVLAPGAVAAGMGEVLAEVGRQEGGLAAVVGGEGQHLVQAGDFTALALESVVVERSRHSVQVSRWAEPAVGVAQAGGSDFQEALLGQVVEGPHQTVAGCAQGLRCRFEVEAGPNLGLLRLLEEAAEEIPALSLEAVQDLFDGHERPELVFGVDRGAGFQVAPELQVGEEGPHHEEPDVVPRREVVEGELHLAGAS